MSVLTYLIIISLTYLGYWKELSIGLTVYYCFKYHWKIWISLKNLPRDLDIIRAAVHLIVKGAFLERSGWTLWENYTKLASKHPDKIAFVHSGRKVTYQQLQDYTLKIGSYFKREGYGKGDVIALLMESRPEYPGIWLGLSRIGVQTALINTNQRKETLVHSICKAVGSKGLIYGKEMEKFVEEIKSELDSRGIKLYSTMEGSPGVSTNDVSNPTIDSIDLDNELKSMKEIMTEKELTKDSQSKFSDKFLYIFTSGTTGLPKAAGITHARFFFMSWGIGMSLKFLDDDVVYTPLPLYHTAGGILGVGQSVVRGLTVVLRSKFSASRFWTDCRENNCTLAQYIGETCRYLLVVPESPETDGKHSVRMMFGNGLRPQIWRDFVSRFKVERIAEFYGSTEGNSNLINAWNKVGAVGYIPWLVKWLSPLKLVKVDTENNPIRDPVSGLCLESDVGEPGLMIGKIDESKIIYKFEGYADEESTQKKILKNVFKNGDLFFNSGDILYCDEDGYFYFRDRTGDTFRWRGENVATCEVEAIISNIIGLKDCIVYGVEVPGAEGKAGMAAILNEGGNIDKGKLGEGIKNSLPPYARPLFLRMMEKLPMTGTFKLQKIQVVKEGFDPNLIDDPLFILESKTNSYVPLTKEMYNDLIHGKIRL